MKAIARFLVTAICVIITSYLLPGIEVSGGVLWAIIIAAVLGILNMFLKPLLVVLSIPITFITLGLFLLIINGFIVWLTGQIVPEHFKVASIWWAILFSVVLSITNSITESILGLKDKKD